MPVSPLLFLRHMTEASSFILTPSSSPVLTTVNDSRYFCYWLNARPGQEQFRVEGLGTAQVNISVPIVQNAVVCIPPREEQVQIANWIEQEVTRWNRLMDRISRAIDHLREFRTALISAAVTGKIDVREAMPR